MKKVEKLDEELDDDNKTPKLETEGDYELFFVDLSKQTKLLKVVRIYQLR